MRIDFHVHANTTDPAAIREFVTCCERLETIVCLCAPGPRCDTHGLTNDETLAIARQFSGRIIPFAFVDLWDTVDVSCVEHFADQGFKGLKIITPYHAYDHDLYMPVYEKAEQVGLPILFHTGLLRPAPADVIHRRPMLQNMRPVTLDRVARSFPKLKIVMAHLGTTIFRQEAAEMVKLHPNLYADLAGSGSWKALEASDLGDLLGSCVQHVDASFGGFKKLILGSDGYLTIPRLLDEAQAWYSRTLDRVGVPPEIIDAIMGGTAAAWLGVGGRK